jgi:hypothetical protein
VYGTLTPPYLLGHLPLPAALYGVLVFPFIWGLTEQMTYNGYLVPRFQVLCRSTSVAIAVVALACSMQHAFMPLTFDAKFMAFRLLAPVPFFVQTLLYLHFWKREPTNGLDTVYYALSREAFDPTQVQPHHLAVYRSEI